MIHLMIFDAVIFDILIFDDLIQIFDLYTEYLKYQKDI